MTEAEFLKAYEKEKAEFEQAKANGTMRGEFMSPEEFLDASGIISLEK